MVKMIAFQSGSDGNCILIHDEYRGLILDAGVTPAFVFKVMKEKHNVDLRKLDLSIYVSHEHSDHNAFEKEWLSFAKPFEPTPAQTVTLEHSVPCTGLAFEFGGLKIFWATDTKSLPDNPNYEDCDVYLVECNYSIFQAMVEITDIQPQYRKYVGRDRHLAAEILLPWLDKHIGPSLKHIHLLHLTTRDDQKHLYDLMFKQLQPIFDKKTFKAAGCNISYLESASAPSPDAEYFFEWDVNPFLRFN